MGIRADPENTNAIKCYKQYRAVEEVCRFVVLLLQIILSLFFRQKRQVPELLRQMSGNKQLQSGRNALISIPEMRQ